MPVSLFIIYSNVFQSHLDRLTKRGAFLVRFPAVADFDTSVGVKGSLKEFQAQLFRRKVWMASSIHMGEDEGN